MQDGGRRNGSKSQREKTPCGAVPPSLFLTLTHEWFDKMLLGQKDIEYREATAFWRKRIWLRKNEITHVTFSRGYTKTRMTRQVLSIDLGTCPYPDFNAPYYYRIRLGAIVKGKLHV